ncbi:OLC1v1028356C1 [Oldenlandia corymbosa var. corymbosa]|uniref:OLC1v1028356C1 n=1 Tax=Oldenlandia corymbosa var. corymbosa TaxID=529605 RepID=A0AAV1CDI2_OLDCO|nr:OLC1v1028356C1 [Oldenlandia corymbosa var. corymbosa]
MALNHISFPQGFLPIAVLLLAIHGKAALAAVESPFCSQTNPGDERILCNNLVNGAPTWQAALTNVVEAGAKEVAPVKALISNLPKVIPPDFASATKKSMVSTCKESVDMFNGCITKILDNLKGRGPPDVSVDTELSAIFNSLSTCTDGLNEFGADSSQIQKYTDLAYKYASLGLAVSATKPK